jgi:hypothetical protein
MKILSYTLLILSIVLSLVLAIVFSLDSFLMSLIAIILSVILILILIINSFCVIKFKKINISPFKFLLISIILIIFPIISFKCFSVLPRYYTYESIINNKKFTEEPEVVKSKFNEEFFVIVPRDSYMSFGSGSNIIGLYNKYNLLIDEISIGAIPVKIISWSNDRIILQLLYDQEKDIKSNININKSLGKYKLQFKYLGDSFL